MKKQFALRLLAIPAAVAASLPAHATGALDDFVTTATTGVTAWQTAALAILSAIATTTVVIWGVKKAIAFFGRRGG